MSVALLVVERLRANTTWESFQHFVVVVVVAVSVCVDVGIVFVVEVVIDVVAATVSMSVSMVLVLVLRELRSQPAAKELMESRSTFE